MGNGVPVSISQWPEVDGSLVDPTSESIEEVVKGVYEDVKEILRATGRTPRLICLYRAAEWKWRVHEALRTAGEKRIDLPALLERAGIPKGGDAMVYAARALRELPRIQGERLRLDRSLELRALEEASSLLSDELGAEVRILEEGQEGIYDPIGKAKQAQPLRPAIYIE
jgi:hypothetical protein